MGSRAPNGEPTAPEGAFLFCWNGGSWDMKTTFYSVDGTGEVRACMTEKQVNREPIRRAV